MAVLLDNIMERLEKLEKQVNNSTLTRQELSNQIDKVSIIDKLWSVTVERFAINNQNFWKTQALFR